MQRCSGSERDTQTPSDRRSESAKRTATPRPSRRAVETPAGAGRGARPHAHRDRHWPAAPALRCFPLTKPTYNPLRGWWPRVRSPRCRSICPKGSVVICYRRVRGARPWGSQGTRSRDPRRSRPLWPQEQEDRRSGRRRPPSSVHSQASDPRLTLVSWRAGTVPGGVWVAASSGSFSFSLISVMVGGEAEGGRRHPTADPPGPGPASGRRASPLGWGAFLQTLPPRSPGRNPPGPGRPPPPGAGGESCGVGTEPREPDEPGRGFRGSAEDAAGRAGRRDAGTRG